MQAIVEAEKMRTARAQLPNFDKMHEQKHRSWGDRLDRRLQSGGSASRSRKQAATCTS